MHKYIKMLKSDLERMLEHMVIDVKGTMTMGHDREIRRQANELAELVEHLMEIECLEEKLGFEKHDKKHYDNPMPTADGNPKSYFGGA